MSPLRLKRAAFAAAATTALGVLFAVPAAADTPPTDCQSALTVLVNAQINERGTSSDLKAAKKTHRDAHIALIKAIKADRDEDADKDGPDLADSRLTIATNTDAGEDTALVGKPPAAVPDDPANPDTQDKALAAAKQADADEDNPNPLAEKPGDQQDRDRISAQGVADQADKDLAAAQSAEDKAQAALVSIKATIKDLHCGDPGKDGKDGPPGIAPGVPISQSSPSVAPAPTVVVDNTAPAPSSGGSFTQVGEAPVGPANTGGL